MIRSVKRALLVFGASATLVAASVVVVGDSPALAAVDPDGIVETAGASSTTDYAYPSDAVFVAPAGADSNTGTKQAPVKTLSAAIAKVRNGGTVVMRGGVYRQTVGTDYVFKAVSIQAYPHEKPVISGADVIKQWAKVGNSFVATNWTSPFGQRNFRAPEVNPAFPAAGHVEQVYRNGTALKQVLKKGQLASGTFFIDPVSKQLTVFDNPELAEMEVTTRKVAIELASPDKGTAIKGVTFTSFASPHLDAVAPVVSYANGIVVENSTFTRSSGAGFFTGEREGVVFRNNTVVNNGSEGAGFNRVPGAVIENNVFANNNAEHFDTVNCDWACTVGGVKMAHTSNAHISKNVFAGNASNGFWCDLGCADATIENNVAINNAGAGLFYEVSTRGTIANNYVANNTAEGIWLSGSDHTTVSGNSIKNNAVQLQVYDDDRNPTNADDYSAQNGITWEATNNSVANNVFEGGPNTTLLLQTNASSTVDAPMMFDQLQDNVVSGTETISWYERIGYKRFETLDEFASNTNFAFTSEKKVQIQLPEAFRRSWSH